MAVPLRLVRNDDDPADDAAPQVAFDPSDVAAVYRQHAPYVKRLAARLLGARQEVDDLVQDVFLDAHRGIRRLTNPQAVRAWLTTVTVRKARRQLRKRRALQFIGLERTTDVAEAFDRTRTADEVAMAAALYRILDSLPSDARCAWILHRVEGESLERVAEVCGFSRATAHRRIMEAHVRLEREFSDVGG